MAAVLQSHTMTTDFHRRPAHAGILLSPPPSKHILPRPSSNSFSSSSASASSTSSASSSSSHTSLNTPTTEQQLGSPLPSSRRIRFAPLPDPRRSVLITDNGDELPLPEDATSIPCPPTPTVTQHFDTSAEPEAPYYHDTSSLSSHGSSSKRNSYGGDVSSSTSSTPGTMTPISTTPEDNTLTLPASPSVSPASPLSPLTFTKKPLPSPVAKSSSSKTKSLLFRPFKRSPDSSSSSTHTLTPTQSLEPTPTQLTHSESRSSQRSGNGSGGAFSRMNISTEEILTLGTINLFRASSRDSRAAGSASNDKEDTGGWGLTRWTSASSGKRDTSPQPSWGSPLARSQSSQSYKGGRSASSFLSSPLSSSANNQALKANKAKMAPITASLSTGAINPRKGTRMLNGRVYGGKRDKAQPNANPFANARDEEPEFVEWGYGGMGSVKGASSAGGAGVWEKLQSSNTGVVVGSHGADDGDGDDGSGMGWIKKRREERERLRREKEEQEAKKSEATEDGAAAEGETKTEESSGKAVDSGAKKEHTPNLHEVVPASASNTRPTTPAASANMTPTPSAGTPGPSTPAAAEEEHVLRAVTLPAHFRHHHHHRTTSRAHSRSGSVDLLSATATPSSETDAQDIGVIGTLDNETVISQEPAEEDASTSDSDSDSDTESDSEGQNQKADDEEDDDDEEEEDEEAAQKARMTALSAGVEKISRHKEKDGEGAVSGAPTPAMTPGVEMSEKDGGLAVPGRAGEAAAQ